MLLPAPPDRLVRQEAARAHYAAQAKAPATQAAYARQWQAFATWCHGEGVEALPALPATVADYAIARARGGVGASSIRQVLSAIAHVHAREGLAPPTLHPQLRTVVQGILREHARPTAEAEPLMPEHLRRIVALLDPTVRGVRDLALLSFGISSGMRRSELSGLLVEHLRRDREGVTVFLPRSKGDQLGEGHRRRVCRGAFIETCPVSALEAWLRQAGIEEGPVFRPVSRWGSVFDRPLSPRRIDEIVRELTRQLVDGDPSALPGRRYSAHSLRAGLCTAAAIAGKPEHEIRAHVGHKSAQTTARYIRAAKVQTSTLTSGIGL